MENGKYHLIANATWLSLLHSCDSRLGDSKMAYETYTVNPMDLKIIAAIVKLTQGRDLRPNFEILFLL